jgi:hypothetical protein
VNTSRALAASPWRNDPAIIDKGRRHVDQQPRLAYRCVVRSCRVDVSGAALFCDRHLFDFDHPALLKAPVGADVSA